MTVTISDPSVGDVNLQSLDTHDDNRRALVIGIVSMFVVIVTIFMGVRVYVRGYTLKGWGLDDSAYIWSGIAFMGQASVVLLNATRGGLGFHRWDSSPEELHRSVRYLTAMVLLYQFAFASIKATFLLQYRRAFALPSVQIFCDTLLVVTIFVLVAISISGGLVMGRFFAPDFGPSDQRRFLNWCYSNAAINLATDITIFILPLPLVWQLRLATMQKVGLIASFGVGILTGAISVVRFATLQEVIEINDFNYTAVPLILLSVAEPTSAIVCACVPILRPLIARWGGSPSATLHSGGHLSGATSDSAGRRIITPNMTPHSPPPQSPTSPTMPQMARMSCISASIQGDLEGFLSSEQAKRERPVSSSAQSTI